MSEKENVPERFADMVDPDKNLVSKLAILGITIDDQIRQLVALRDDDGVLVAAFAGPRPYLGDQLREADVIHAVNGRPVSSVETLRTELDSAEIQSAPRDSEAPSGLWWENDPQLRDRMGRA